MTEARLKGYILYDFIYVITSKKDKNLREQNINNCQMLRMGKGLTTKEPKKTFWGDGTILYLDCAVKAKLLG